MDNLTKVGNRRDAIAEAVLALAADGGSRAVTHSAVDRRLRLPKGSASYYFRSRAELIEAGIDLIRRHSHASFSGLLSDQSRPPTEVVRDYIIHLITDRSTEVRARLALAPEVGPDTLSNPFFSHSSATTLFAATGSHEPELAATGFLDLLEGLLLRAAFGSRLLTADEISAIVDIYLTGANGNA